MKEATFTEKIQNRWSQVGMICVGLDPDFAEIPAVLKAENSSIEDVLFAFNREIIDATADLVCAYKPNIAFYEAHGEAGARALARTVAHIRDAYSEIPIILDAKRADIGNTNLYYVKAVFDELGADAITIHPYLGKEAVQPFLDRKDKGVIVLVKTSNSGGGEFQNLKVADSGEPLYKVVARNIANSWNANGNCSVVVGATYPEELAEVRTIIGDMPILIPGIGAQGGDIQKTVMAGKDSKGFGMIISASRSIIFASSGADFAQASRKATEGLVSEIQAIL